ncbi:MAG: oxidoreductase [Chitinophagia bacterium]|nr:oxidoreductase [Chitinophagia bacterium]
MRTLPTLLLATSLLEVTAMHNRTDTAAPWRFITLDPGHFHAALVQKRMYPEVDPTVHVYAPTGEDLRLHLARIEGYNTRKADPTAWREVLHTDDDFLGAMLRERKGNVVMLAGNNRKKTEYIAKSIDAGFHVFADKPMAIDAEGYRKLEKAFRTARRKGLMLYDIMTERYEIATILQRELSMRPEAFGTLQKGSPDQPAITKESVHHFYKEVSGSPLQRPAWFYDVAQQGAGIVDVTTHLVDLVQWEAFPEQVIDYPRDIRLLTARQWNTAVSLPQFTASTSMKAFPEYLAPNVDANGVLQVASNGQIDYTIRGVHARVSVIWNYRAEPGGGDTHFSIMRGSRSDLVIRQGRETGFIPRLYIESKPDLDEAAMRKSFAELEKRYPGISLTANPKGWEVSIPASYHNGHEAHFAQVTEKYLGFLKSSSMPAWEVPNMLAKYRLTTTALAQSLK